MLRHSSCCSFQTSAFVARLIIQASLALTCTIQRSLQSGKMTGCRCNQERLNAPEWAHLLLCLQPDLLPQGHRLGMHPFAQLLHMSFALAAGSRPRCDVLPPICASGRKGLPCPKGTLSGCAAVSELSVCAASGLLQARNHGGRVHLQGNPQEVDQAHVLESAAQHGQQCISLAFREWSTLLAFTQPGCFLLNRMTTSPGPGRLRHRLSSTISPTHVPLAQHGGSLGALVPCDAQAALWSTQAALERHAGKPRSPGGWHSGGGCTLLPITSQAPQWSTHLLCDSQVAQCGPSVSDRRQHSWCL